MDYKKLLEKETQKIENLKDEELKNTLKNILKATKYLCFTEGVTHKGVNELAKRLIEVENELQSLNRRINDLEYYHN